MQSEAASSWHHKAQFVNASLFSVSLFLLSSGSEASSPFVARLLVAPGQITRGGRDAAALLAQLRAAQALHFSVRALLQKPLLEEQKIVFCLPQA